MNLIVLSGNLTRSPELRYTPSGIPVATVGLASNRKFKQDNDLKEEVCFVDVTAFGKTAEAVAQWLDKGDKIQVEGRLQQRRWETDDGQKRSKHEIIANHIEFLRTKKGAQQQGDSSDPEHEGTEHYG